MAADYAVPHDRTLTELTEELVRGLASTNPQVRDALAYPTLATWLERGVYDDLLPGFGDGLCAGLNYGLGEDGTDTVFRRSFTALTLAEVIHRDNAEFLVHDEVVMRWGDRLATWVARRRRLRAAGDLAAARARPARVCAGLRLGARCRARRRRDRRAGPVPAL